jgi:hypothetical protein
MPRFGSSVSKTRPPAKTSRPFGISRCGATASAKSSRARSAASIAALPIIKVTRLE